MQVQFRSMLLVLASILLLSCDFPICTEHTITSSGFGALRILQISDLHYRSDNPVFSLMIDKINTLNYDVLVFTGDVIDKKENINALIDCLSQISSASPKFAILGNWEYFSQIPIQEYSDRLASIGIHLLINERVILDTGESRASITGLDDYLGGQADLSVIELESDMHNIVLAHCPAQFDSIAGVFGQGHTDVLVLSGHTHGGQITAFGLALVLPPGSGQYTSGLYKIGRCTLFVSKGVGNSTINLRIFADPSIELLVLNRD